MASILRVGGTGLPHARGTGIIRFVLGRLGRVTPRLPRSCSKDSIKHVAHNTTLALGTHLRLFRRRCSSYVTAYDRMVKLNCRLFPSCGNLFGVTGRGGSRIVLSMRCMRDLCNG